MMSLISVREKTRYRRDTVGDAVGHQHLLQDARLMVAPIEDRRNPHRVRFMNLWPISSAAIRSASCSSFLANSTLSFTPRPARRRAPCRRRGVVGDQDVGALEDAPLGAVVCSSLMSRRLGKSSFSSTRFCGLAPRQE